VTPVTDQARGNRASADARHRAYWGLTRRQGIGGGRHGRGRPSGRASEFPSPRRSVGSSPGGGGYRPARPDVRARLRRHQERQGGGDACPGGRQLGRGPGSIACPSGRRIETL